MDVQYVDAQYVDCKSAVGFTFVDNKAIKVDVVFLLLFFFIQVLCPYLRVGAHIFQQSQSSVTSTYYSTD